MLSSCHMPSLWTRCMWYCHSSLRAHQPHVKCSAACRAGKISREGSKALASLWMTLLLGWARRGSSWTSWMVTMLMKLLPKVKLGPSYCIISCGFLIKRDQVISNFNIISVKMYPTDDWILKLVPGIYQTWGKWHCSRQRPWASQKTRRWIQDREGTFASAKQRDRLV